jgi:hypothetical protein
MRSSVILGGQPKIDVNALFDMSNRTTLSGIPSKDVRLLRPHRIYLTELGHPDKL